MLRSQIRGERVVTGAGVAPAWTGSSSAISKTSVRSDKRHLRSALKKAQPTNRSDRTAATTFAASSGWSSRWGGAGPLAYSPLPQLRLGGSQKLGDFHQIALRNPDAGNATRAGEQCVADLSVQIVYLVTVFAIHWRQFLPENRGGGNAPIPDSELEQSFPSCLAAAACGSHLSCAVCRSGHNKLK